MPAVRTVSAPRAPRSSAGVTRALLVLVAIGALAAGAVSVLVGAPAGTKAALSPSLASTPSVSPPPSPTAKAVPAVTPGTCLTWAGPVAEDITTTACPNPHLFEVAADVDLGAYSAARFGPDAAFPSSTQLAALRTEVCTPAVTTYLGQRFDPYGVYSVGLINPGEAGWVGGERTLRCGLQRVDASSVPIPVTGTVAASDQSDVTVAGTCLSLDPALPAGLADCAGPHTAETVAVVDLTARFPAGFPAVAESDAYLTTTCAAAADAYIGVVDGAATKGLTVFWQDLHPQSWAAGSRQINCYVGRQQPGGGFGAVTGSAKGVVTVAAAVTAPTTAPTTAPAVPAVPAVPAATISPAPPRSGG